MRACAYAEVVEALQAGTAVSPERAPTRLRVVAPVLGVAGLATLTFGTFLPWLRSGSVLRNSYQTDGAIRQLLQPGEPIKTALAAWPAVSFACAAVVALYAVSMRRSAAALAVVTALIAAAVATAALAAGAVQSVRAESSGPTVTLVGSVLVLLAVSVQVAIVTTAWREPR